MLKLAPIEIGDIAMEHEELVFHSLAAAQQALSCANSAWPRDPEHQGEAPPEAEILPVYPEDPNNPGSLPCEETDPEWRGDYCIFSKNCEWCVSNTDPEWVFVA